MTQTLTKESREVIGESFGSIQVYVYYIVSHTCFYSIGAVMLVRCCAQAIINFCLFRFDSCLSFILTMFFLVGVSNYYFFK